MWLKMFASPPPLSLVQTFDMVCLLFAGQDSFKTTDILNKEDQKHKISSKNLQRIKRSTNAVFTKGYNC